MKTILFNKTSLKKKSVVTTNGVFLKLLYIFVCMHMGVPVCVCVCVYLCRCIWSLEEGVFCPV